MNKKLYEWVFYLSIPFLVHGCIRFQNQGELWYAAACSVALIAISVWYYYFVKYRPMRVHQESLNAVAMQHGFSPVAGTASERIATLLRQFTGFDDTSVKVDGVHVRKDSRGIYSLGRYAIGGQSGIHFGFFVLGVFQSVQPRLMSADIIGGEAYATADEREPVIDPRLTSALQGLRYNWFVRGTSVLVDFDTREIRRDGFVSELTGATTQIPTLGDFFESADLEMRSLQ